MYKKISSYKSRIFILKRSVFVGVFILLACHQYSEKHLRVAVASNLQYRMTEVVQLFETQYNVKVDVVVASSGKLTHQITQGAPFDVFCGADTVYTNYIKQHMNLQHDIHIFSHGMLIFWSKQPIDSSKGIDILTDKRV